MRFYKLLKYDLKNGLVSDYIKLSVLILIVVAFCFDFYLRKYNVYLFEEQMPSGTFVDYLLYFFAGMKEYLPTGEEGFIFPIRWSLLHLYIFYCTLHYPSKDLTSVGVNILLRTKGRTSWWLSKSIWNICYVLAVYLLIFLTVMLFCLVMKEPIHLDITAMFMNDILEAKSPYETFSTNLVWITLFFPLLFSIGMNLWQMTLTLFFKPLYSFGASSVILLASAYFFHPLFPGNHAMPIRSVYVVENGFSISSGMWMFLVLMFSSIAIGTFCFQRYDILGEES